MQKCTILIVENDPLNTTILREMCNSFGLVTCLTTKTTNEALQCLSECDIDLIFLDIDIETEYAGMHLAKILKQKYSIPFVFITDKTDKNTIDMAAKLEPYAYLIKPIDPLIFLAQAKIALYQSATMQLQENNKRNLLGLYQNCVERKQ